MSNEVPTVEEYQKLLKTNEELSAQLKDRNEALKEAKEKSKGNDSQDIETIARAAASAELEKVLEPLRKQNEELKTALSGRPGVAVSSGGSETVSKPASKWTPEQLAHFEKLKIDPEKVSANIK